MTAVVTAVTMNVTVMTAAITTVIRAVIGCKCMISIQTQECGVGVGCGWQLAGCGSRDHRTSPPGGVWEGLTTINIIKF